MELMHFNMQALVVEQCMLCLYFVG